MKFPEMAVMTCVADLKGQRISEYHVRTVLRCRVVDVSPIAVFLNDSNTEVRMAAVRIVGEKGDADLLVELVKRETEKTIITEALRWIAKRGKRLEELIGFLQSSDLFLRQEFIAAFKTSGRVDCLFPLLFDEDEKIVSQVKGYMK